MNARRSSFAKATEDRVDPAERTIGRREDGGLKPAATKRGCTGLKTRHYKLPKANDEGTENVWTFEGYPGAEV